MPEAAEFSISGLVGEAVKRHIFELQDYTSLALRSVTNIFTPPFYVTDILDQMDVIGVGSLPIVLLTGFFIGAVLVMQTAAQFERFGRHCGAVGLSWAFCRRG